MIANNKKYFAAIDYHGYTGDLVLVVNEENDTLVKVPEYADWYFNFPVYDLPTREKWEMCGVNFNKPIAIDVGYVATKDSKVANMMCGLNQLLKDLLDIPTEKVHRCNQKVVEYCKHEDEGQIIFTIYNI